MSLIHIVQFKFKPGTDEKTIRGVCDDLLSLKDKAIHPTSKKPYIRSASGGRDNSPEGLQNGFTHAFVLEFDNEEDRNFYVKQDEAHLAFVAGLEGLVDGAQVLDYTPGKYLVDSVILHLRTLKEAYVKRFHCWVNSLIVPMAGSRIIV